MSNPPINMLELWEKGQTLQNILDKFSPPKIEYAPHKTPKKEELLILAEAEQWQELGKILTVATKNSIKYFENNSYPKKQLLEKLTSKELIGLGFELPRKSSDQLTLIPSDIWQNAKLDSENSSVKSQSLEFESVRIIPAKLIFNLNLKVESNVLKRKVGRPSSRDIIVKAYNELKNTGLVNYSVGLKSNISIIQNKIIHINPEYSKKPPKYDAIRKAIYSNFKEMADRVKKL